MSWLGFKHETSRIWMTADVLACISAANHHDYGSYQPLGTSVSRKNDGPWKWILARSVKTDIILSRFTFRFCFVLRQAKLILGRPVSYFQNHTSGITLPNERSARRRAHFTYRFRQTHHNTILRDRWYNKSAPSMEYKLMLQCAT